MSPDIVELIDDYYEAKKPYMQSLFNSHDDSPPQYTSPETTTTSSDPQEPQFSTSPRIPNEEIMNVLKKLEAAKIECVHAGGSTAEASVKKKGKAPVGKK